MNERIEIEVVDVLSGAESLVSMEALGLYLKIRARIAQSARPGYLLLNGVPIPPDRLPGLLGLSQERWDALMHELTVTSGALAWSKEIPPVLFHPGTVEVVRKRAMVAVRVNNHRQKKKVEALRNAPCNGECNGQCNECVTRRISLDLDLKEPSNKKDLEKDAALHPALRNANVTLPGALQEADPPPPPAPPKAPVKIDAGKDPVALFYQRFVEVTGDVGLHWGNGKAANNARNTVLSRINSWGMEETVQKYVKARGTTCELSISVIGSQLMQELLKKPKAVTEQVGREQFGKGDEFR